MHLRILLFLAWSAVCSRASLTGHWQFNENSGTTAANAANAAFPGTLTSFTAGSEWTAGPGGQGSAILLDGMNDYVNTSFTGVTGGAVRSFAAWIKYPVTLDAQLDCIFGYGSNATSARWTVRIGSSAGSGINQLRLEVSGGGVFGGPFLNDDQWHHIAVVQTGTILGSVLLYVDGVAVALTYNGTGAPLAINTTVAAGQEVAIGNSKHSLATYAFQGGIDDARFYNHALTPAEVTALYSPVPRITSFSALPGNLTLPGQQATLSWSGSAQPGATWSLAPTPGDVTAQTVNGSGSAAVTPAATTTYTVTVTDAFGSANAQTTVGVNEPQQHPVLNEVMAANDGYLDDENGDTPDWIELRNPNAFTISVEGYRLRDGGRSDWVFPANTFITGGGYLRVFASNKDRTNPALNLHTNFSLDADGETLALRAPGGATVVDSMPAIVFPDNVTWGRVSDGATQNYLASPTPGAANTSAGNPGPRIEDVTIALPGERQPVRPLLESGTIAADSIDQFSGVQGQNGWTYGYTTATAQTYTPAGFTAFPGGDGQGAWNAVTQNWNAGNTQWGASWERGLTTSPNCDLGANYTLPSTTGGVSATVRRWTSTFAGPAVLSGFFHHVPNAGDGTRWQIFVNGTAVLDSDPATAGRQPYTVRTVLRRWAVPVTLAAGDLVDMVCDAGTTETSDTSRGWLRVWQNPETVTAAHDASLPVSTTVTPTSGAVTGATLFYAINFNAEQSLAMTDAAGTWSASIPLIGVNAGDMIRWRITAADSAGGTRTSPSFPSGTDSPKYHGTVAAGTNPAARTQLGMLSVFIQNVAGAESAAGARGSIFWDGRFYDNIDINLHASSAYAKRSWDVDFNKGHRFKYTAAGAGHTDINILTNWRDRSKLRNPMSYRMFAIAGHPTLHCETVHLELNGLYDGTFDLTGELNEGSLEDAGYDKNGALYKMQNLFRTYPTDATSGIEKRTRKWEAGTADLSAFLNGMVNLSNTDDITGAVNNSPRFRFLCDNADVSSVVNFIAGMFWSTSYDWGHKNYALYFDADGTRRWTPMLWDLDLSWGHYYDAAAIANTYFDDVIRTNTNDGTIHNFSLNHNQMEFATPNKNSLFAYALEDPTLKAMILRRLRQLADNYFLATGPAPEIEGHMELLTDKVDPLAIAESDADLDLRIWGYWNQHQTATNTYTPRSAREETGRIIDTFVPARRGLYFNDSPPLGPTYGGPVPGSTPQEALPLIQFATYDGHPASGNQDHEFIEIANIGTDYVDLSGWTLRGGVTFTFPAGTVISPPGNTRFDGKLIIAKSAAGWRTRAVSPKAGEGRMVLMAYDGQIDRTGETIFLSDAGGQIRDELTIGPAPTDQQRWLRVTEVHYHPTDITPAELAADPLATTNDFEFIEVTNTSAAPLDISGCVFDNGITFTFPASTTLAAGQRAVVSRKPGALALRSPGLSGGFGPHSTNLDNGGERITLRDATGEMIETFVYDDIAPWPVTPDGTGPSLVCIHPSLDGNLPTSWRASTAADGNPTTSDSVPFTGNGNDDTDADGLTALMEYALGTSDSTAGPFAPLVWNPATGTITLEHAAAADDAALVLESSTDLTAWGSTGILQHGTTPLAGGKVLTTWQLSAGLSSSTRLYLRARAVLLP